MVGLVWRVSHAHVSSSHLGLTQSPYHHCPLHVYVSSSVCTLLTVLCVCALCDTLRYRWIRRWLLVLMGTMSTTFLIALVHLLLLTGQAVTQGPGLLLEKALPLLYAMLAALQYVWLLSEPFAYLMKGSNPLAIPPRWLEVGVALLMIGGIFGLLEATRIVSSGP